MSATDETQGSKGDERSPEQIRAEIESTREELGDTVAALAEKADVKAQAKKKVDETKAQVKEKVTGATEDAKAKAQQFGGKAQGATPESAGVAADQAKQAVQENPVPAAAVGALVFGFLIGWLLGKRR